MDDPNQLDDFQEPENRPQTTIDEEFESPLQLALLDPDTEIQLASFESSQEKTSSPAPEEKEPKSGFSLPFQNHFGEEGQVQSIPTDLTLEHSLNDFNTIKFHAHQLKANAAAIPSNVGINPMPGFMPFPELQIRPEIKIDDTLINHEDKATFQVSLNVPQNTDVTMGFNYPGDVVIMGGDGVASVDASTHSGIMRIPAGTTSVHIETKLTPESALEPGEHFDLHLVDDQQGLKPNFIKPIGTAIFDDTTQESILAKDDSYWAFHLDQKHNYNLIFMLDISGSMSSLLNQSKSKLEQAKQALVEFIDYYQQASDNLNITLIPFASAENNHGAFSYRALSVQDAKDFVLNQGIHQGSGIEVRMNNPDTGAMLGRGTHYNDALYQGRVVLEQDLLNASLADYAHKVYFISDGVPTPFHSATDQQDWPQSWGTWKDFISLPKTHYPASFADNIDVFAVSIGENSTIEAAMNPIVVDTQSILSANFDLSTLSELLLTTVPDYFHANVLANDQGLSKSVQVTSIRFQADDAENYILDHHLDFLGAQVVGHAIMIPLPQTQNFIQLDTPLGGKLWLNHAGELFYLSPSLEQDAKEVFQYEVNDSNTGQNSQALIEINIIGKTTPVHHIQGDNSSNTLSTTGLEGIIVLEGYEGNNTFIVDMQGPQTQQVLIQDLFTQPGNTLQLLVEQAQGLEFDDLFTNDFYQSDPNEPLQFRSYDATTTLFLEHPDDYQGNSFAQAFDYLQGNVHINIL